MLADRLDDLADPDGADDASHDPTCRGVGLRIRLPQAVQKFRIVELDRINFALRHGGHMIGVVRGDVPGDLPSFGLKARDGIGSWMTYYNPVSSHPSVYAVEVKRFC